MQCRSCGTEIADKAIICFRCGAPTLDVSAARPASDSAGGREPRWLVRIVGLLLGAGAVVLAALFVDDTGVRVAVVTGGVVLGGGLWRFLGRRRARRGAGGVH